MSKNLKKVISKNFKGVWYAIKYPVLWIWNLIKNIFIWIKNILIASERVLKIIALFIITISASILFLTGSLYLFTRTFDLNKSPAFIQARDGIALLFVKDIKEELNEIEMRENKENLDRNFKK